MRLVDKRLRILVLGAGNAQTDLISACHEREMEVYGCSYSNDDPGIPMLDHFAQINITDADSLCSYAGENEVDFVYSVGSDLAVPSVSLISERLGLPHFVSSETASLCCNKELLRSVLADTPYSVPFLCIEDEKELEGLTLSFPVEVKPVDSQGQRGVSKASCFDELLAGFRAAKQYARCGKVIVEAYLAGNEVSVNTYMRDGELCFFMITNRESFAEFPGGIIKRHYIPAVLPYKSLEEDIRCMVKDIADKTGVRNGPVYYQIMICGDKPYLIEMSPRLDGCHMWRLIRMYCGTDLLAMSLDDLIKTKAGRTKASGTAGSQKAAATGRPLITEFFSEPPGTRFRRSQYEQLPALYRQYYYHDREEVRSTNGYMEKCGYRIFENPDLRAELARIKN